MLLSWCCDTYSHIWIFLDPLCGCVYVLRLCVQALFVQNAVILHYIISHIVSCMCLISSALCTTVELHYFCMLYALIARCLSILFFFLAEVQHSTLSIFSVVYNNTGMAGLLLPSTMYFELFLEAVTEINLQCLWNQKENQKQLLPLKYCKTGQNNDMLLKRYTTLWWLPHYLSFYGTIN